MDIDCISSNQGGVDLYVGAISAGKLVPRTKVDVHTPTNPTGYQRPLADRRIAEVVHYLENSDGVFPSSVLLSYRAGNSRFHPARTQEIATTGTLALDDETPLYVIDGQHRIAALKKAIADDPGRYCNYSVPFTLLINPDVFDEARWFYLVNSKAKRVPVELAEQLLAQAAEEKGEDWLRTSEAPETSTRGDQMVMQARLVHLVNRLGDGCPVWKGHIIRPGEKAKSKMDVKAHTMLTSLARGGALSDRSFQKALDQSPESLAEVLCNYWQAIASKWPTAINDGKVYSLRGTQGLYSLHAIFPDVLALCREERDYSVGNIEKILDHIRAEDDFWSRTEGHQLTSSTSMGILRRLARHLRDQLPETALPGI